ncbi:MAG: hypothetical protein AAGA33_13920 [Pseudomonadota bacterium]
MPRSSEQRTVRADLTTQVLSLLLLFGVAGSASASSTGHTVCQSDACAIRAQQVDYTITRDKTPEIAKSAEDRESLKKSSLALSTERDTTVLRDQYVQSDLELPAFDDDVTDPVARLLERRSLQKDEDVETTETPAMKSALPGVDAEELRLFREKMYRTDI